MMPKKVFLLMLLLVGGVGCESMQNGTWFPSGGQPSSGTTFWKKDGKWQYSNPK
jgi:hypothetical protein